MRYYCCKRGTGTSIIIITKAFEEEVEEAERKKNTPTVKVNVRTSERGIRESAFNH